ncbi:MAG: hypothetical protein U1F43_16725 [Myxococcota bacterium]
MAKIRTEPDHTLTGYPPGVLAIIGNEGCERFSFYGMRAILKVYIAGLFVHALAMKPELARDEANATYHLFGAAVYAFPMIGAVLAERLLGRYRTIFWLSLVYCAGHAVLSMTEGSVTGMYVGLGLIALGSGGIKPCVSANVGDQFGKRNWHLLGNIYNWFYFVINFGSFFAQLIIPAIRGKELAPGSYSGDVSLAFAIPGILMGLATIFFWSGRNKFVRVPPTPAGGLGLLDSAAGILLFMVFGWPVFFAGVTPTSTATDVVIALGCLAGFFAVFALRQKRSLDRKSFLMTLLISAVPGLFGSAFGSGKRREGKGFFAPARAALGQRSVDSAVSVLRVMGVFFLVSVFWALFEQHGSTWIDQAKLMSGVLSAGLGGWIGFGAVAGVLVALAIGLSVPKKSRWLGFAGGFAVGMAGALIAYALTAKDGIASITIDPSQIPFLNPLFVMILIPIAANGIYPLMTRLGWEPKPLRRMTLGLVFTASAFVVAAIVQLTIDADKSPTVHMLWQVPQYLLLTMGEVMVSITGLEFGYSQAPKHMKSVVLGLWLLTVALGDLLASFLFGGLAGWGLVDFFWLFAGLMAAAAVGFFFVASFYKYRDVIQGDDEPEDLPKAA